MSALAGPIATFGHSIPATASEDGSDWLPVMLFAITEEPSGLQDGEYWAGGTYLLGAKRTGELSWYAMKHVRITWAPNEDEEE